jgi:hypothetical protein
MMKFRFLLGLLGVFLPTNFPVAQPASVTWPDAVAEVTKWRTVATGCLAGLKEHGKAPDIAQGRIVYAKAKSDSDAVIAGLIVALSDGGKPASLSDLRAKLENGTSNLANFCKMVDTLAPTTPGQRNFITELLKAFTEPAINKLSAAVTVLYENYRTDTAARRETIRIQLEAARWPDFT